eukprot:COSAG01_NODE_5688_length_4100_cov_84.811797_4_plen_83_part_00
MRRPRTLFARRTSQPAHARRTHGGGSQQSTGVSVRRLRMTVVLGIDLRGNNSRSAVFFSRISAGSRFVMFAENILRFVMFAA